MSGTAAKTQRSKERFRSALGRVSALVLIVAESWNVPATLRQVMGVKRLRPIANVASAPSFFPLLWMLRWALVIWLTAIVNLSPFWTVFGRLDVD